ncbi:hypothetical protein ICN84_07815 [Akkermansia glycaniphila]|uniref:hypothetical protein n=1 Tax=Akkermansia glycaniphila TaxID=1679444 RepID=UPI001C00ABA6|nr:hypothetical protein [Akkermansia glycaniphila]MBT9449979.1 hypothetical protein [Akkermansia glycaniphila]
MPTRLIRDGILTSERVSSLSWEAEVFYRRLMSVADDYGLYDARPSILRSALYPLQLDKMSECNIQRCLSACEAAGLILLYSHSGKPFLMILDFGQQSKTAPKWPVPDGYEVQKVTEKKYEMRQIETNRYEPLRLDTYSESETNTENTVESSSTVVSGYPPPPRALPDAGYAEFVRKVCGLKSAWGRIRVLPVKVEEEARRAYESVSLTDGDFELLAAYYASSMPKDRYGSAFWRPSSLERFLQDFVDVLAHAQRWGRETSWGFKPKAVPAPKTDDEPLGDLDSFIELMEGGSDGANP